jgi:hypothetical protein
LGDLPFLKKIGLLSRATCPHTHMVYFQGRSAHTLTLVCFHGQPTHKCSSWFIFRGDQPTRSHGLFSRATCSHTHIGLFLGVSKKTKKPRKTKPKKPNRKKTRLNRFFFQKIFGSVRFGSGFQNPKPAKPQPNQTGSI